MTPPSLCLELRLVLVLPLCPLGLQPKDPLLFSGRNVQLLGLFPPCHLHTQTSRTPLSGKKVCLVDQPPLRGLAWAALWLRDSSATGCLWSRFLSMPAGVHGSPTPWPLEAGERWAFHSLHHDTLRTASNRDGEAGVTRSQKLLPPRALQTAVGEALQAKKIQGPPWSIKL